MLIVTLYCFFFFFSSRRRHTRWNCDWSSDVCSSDLSWIAPGIRRRSVLSTAEPDEAGCVPRFPCFPEREVRARIFQPRRRPDRLPHVCGPERLPEVVLLRLASPRAGAG